MKCLECEGKGYTEETLYTPSVFAGVKCLSAMVRRVVKVYCELCKGTGNTSYEGDRTGTAWERE